MHQYFVNNIEPQNNNLRDMLGITTIVVKDESTKPVRIPVTEQQKDDYALMLSGRELSDELDTL